MKFIITTLIAICSVCLFSSSKPKIIELPLTQQNGYGYFYSSLGGVSPYIEDENNPWSKTYRKVPGVPETWTDVKYGDIEVNMLQTVYQNYLLGNIPEDFYEMMKKSWDWEPDTLVLSKNPLKSNVAFAYIIDTTGVIEMIVDANNNLDFSDDKSFNPFVRSPSNISRDDSLAMVNSIDVSYERMIDNKKVMSTTPLFITYMSELDMLMCNFPQYATTNFEGLEIAVSSDNFTSLTYRNTNIALNDKLDEGGKVRPENIISKNEYIEIKGNLYKNLGVNNNKNVLLLEKMELSNDELGSTQIGYKAHLFEGENFEDQSPVSLNDLKGKYVFLDFWSVSCGPCLQEMPNLKELYDKTDRNKFEIIGIVGDSPSNAVKEIIERYSITWPQILSTDSNNLKKEYSITGYPTTYLIDPDGVIVGKNLRGTEVEEKVLKLIKD